MPDRLPRIITHEQAAALLAAPNLSRKCGVRDAAMLSCMYHAGLRSMEVRGLLAENTHLDENWLDIRKSKGGKSRAVPIPDETVAAIQAWRKIKSRLLVGTHLVFCTLKGFKISGRQLGAMVKRLGVSVGIPREQISPHVLRHTYATELLKEGFTIREVQELLGHASLDTTQIYLHVRPEELRAKVLERAKARGTSTSQEGLVELEAARGPSAELRELVAGMDEREKAALLTMLQEAT